VIEFSKTLPFRFVAFVERFSERFDRSERSDCSQRAICPSLSAIEAACLATRRPRLECATLTHTYGSFWCGAGASELCRGGFENRRYGL